MIAWMVLLACAVYGFFCIYLYLRQRSLLYYPHPATSSSEAAVIWLEHDSQRIKIWAVERGDGPALIYFGGNAEDVSGNLGLFKELVPDYSLYLMNYRGYGGSSGSPSESALYADSLALFDRVRRQHDPVVVMGRSLGSGIATYCAAQRPAAGVVLVTPYASIAALAASHYPFMPVEPLIKDRYDSHRHAAGLAVPILALTAQRDEVIPKRISDALVQSCNQGLIEHVEIGSSGHNDIEQFPSYRKHLKQFLDARAGALSEEP